MTRKEAVKLLGAELLKAESRLYYLLSLFDLAAPEDLGARNTQALAELSEAIQRVRSLLGRAREDLSEGSRK